MSNNIELREASSSHVKWFNILVNDVQTGYCYEEAGSNGLWKASFNNNGLTQGFGSLNTLKQAMAKYFNASIQDVKNND